VLPQLSKFKGAALDLFFPQKCLGCGKEVGLLCRRCQLSLPRILPPICPKCGRPQLSGIICPGCIGWQNNIDGIRSPFKFEGLMRQAVYQFKYKNLRTLAKPLSELLEKYLTRYPLPGEVLVPVPLHHKRLKERGYNQSTLLAEELSKLLKLPVVDNCLVRVKYILPQAQTKSLDERLANVHQAFSCLNSRLQNARILLVDDVSTSGATLDACASALKAAGAISIWGIALSREL
jgi:ComF family protein